MVDHERSIGWSAPTLYWRSAWPPAAQRLSAHRSAVRRAGTPEGSRARYQNL